MKNVTYISVELEDKGRPKERPPKTSWKTELIKKGLVSLQYVSPKKTADIIWHHFTKPGKVAFSENQNQLIERAEMGEMSYKGDRIVTYRWGSKGQKVLLAHGWRSKMADFRKLIEAYLAMGFVVEGVDARAHGRSEGKHTSIPEYRDILKKYMVKNGPYHTVVGYSMGGIAAGIVLSEISKEIQPKILFLLAAPPYVQFFFEQVISDIGCTEAVYDAFVRRVELEYHQPIEYFDLRTKIEELHGIEKFFIYCEDDEMIPFKQGRELYDIHENKHFVQARGFGHYKILSHDEIIRYVINHSKSEVEELASS
ncbi:MAG: alpha/beta hydrolase [Cytophagales bacterium]|nr:alpha/beta hydrolase [Cytophagales bacterium]